MPFWRRYYRSRWRPRYRRLYWRRTRNPFQRRRRRRYRTYRVRRKKLKKLRLTQWQPQYIKRLKIHGYYPVILGTRERVANNLNCYLESTAPHYVPGGGCFSINNFSLMTLYLEHFNLRNWWTTGNDNMPLIRYLGCTINCYREENIDYLFYYNRQWPMTAKLLTYQSTQPMAMLLNKHTVKIACKKNTRNKKPYKKIHIKPPPQMQNKWYFQYDIATQPLLQTMTTACSFDRTFLNSQSVSSTIGFVTLDTNTFLNHHFERTTSPYSPRPNTILFKIKNGAETISKVTAGELILLGEVEDLTDGIEFQHIPNTDLLTPPTIPSANDFQKKIYTARMRHQYWGNVFKSSTFYRDERMIETNLSWDDIIKKLTTSTTQLPPGFTFKTTKWAEIRYNPFSDRGKDNIAYLLKIKTGLHATDWGPPTDKDVIARDLPLHTLLWGFLDYERKCAEYRDIDTTTLLVIQCPYVQPKTFKFLVPLDYSFLDGTSPYRPIGEITPTDRQNWHPKVAFQVQVVNEICLCGPGTVKLPEKTSCEAHISYNFYFKVGGQPPPMSNLTKPDEQPKYPIPNNLINTPSLQSPAIPFTQLLWNFDERRSQLTKKATKRITDYQIPETSLMSLTETSLSCPTETIKAQETSETSSSEEEETPIQEQLNKQRRRQKLLRNRINLLLKQLANM
nr:MAG: ORF1 [TTV-like mini virus]